MEGSQDQFRISTLTAIGLPNGERIPTSMDTPSLKELEAQGFDWDAKRREVFDSMSPRMRASWCVPHAPGTPLEDEEEQKNWPSSVPLEKDAKTDEDRKNVQTALNNFALMLFEPVEVDWAALGVQPNRRTVFKRESSGGKWVEQVVAP